MTDDEIIDELAKFPHEQQEMTRAVWKANGSMRVCWICGSEAVERVLNEVRGYLCDDCYAIQSKMYP